MAGYKSRRLSSAHKALCVLSVSFSLAAGSAYSAPPTDVPGQAVGRPDFPEFNFPDRSNRETAIGRLGNKLPDVAEFYGMTPSEFTRMLREDGTAWIDMKGSLLFIDPHENESSSTESPELLDPAPFPLEDTFTLHSRPGANRIVYLDFDGHVTSGTRWNTEAGIDPIVSPPYTRDSSSSFSDQELQNIQLMWRQVAEDYAPFNVDVTTEDPGEAALLRSSSSDQNYGIRVVVTEDNFDNCGCGGFAYVGVFDSYGNTNYKPAFVFNTSVVGAGEASTHEAGHTLGLRHDGISGGATYYSGHGSGATGWAPIMGSGYSRALVQWSRGEYSGANNSEDDITIIRNNGAPFMVDDHGDTDGTATVLSSTTDGTTATISGSGLIGLEDDQDVFSFLAGSGSYNINIDPAAYSPNLDISAQLKNSAGAVIAQSNPVESLNASLSGTLPGGEYFLHIDGVGKGQVDGTGYSDYSSLGRYAISGTVPDADGLVPPTAVAATQGYVPGYSPIDVIFDGSGSIAGEPEGSITLYEWDFGDGSTGTGVAPTHNYTAPGDYLVTLTVSDNNTPPLTANDSITVEVQNRPPVASATTSSPTSGAAPLTVDFDGSGSLDEDGTIATYSWNFGDGSTSNQPSPSHEYTNWGELTATLTVTDNLGATDQDQVSLSIDPPPFIDQSSSSEQGVAGTVTGDHTRTHDNDGFEQQFRERESGGKKRNRYSYLEHRWIFNVATGNSTRLDIKARQSNSSDGDTMLFAYSVNGGSFQSLPFANGNTGVQSFTLAGNPSGQIVVRLRDSDDTAGNRSLDTFYVDYLNIRTENEGGGVGPTVPNAASWPSSGALVVNSSTEISLNWNDNSSDENGFRVERSEDNFVGGSVTQINLGAGSNSYNDNGLNPATTYFYRIFAYNGTGDATSSGIRSATTDNDVEPPTEEVVLNTRTFKRRGVKHVELTWTGLAPGAARIYFDGNLLTSDESSPFEHNLNSKGGGSYTYQVCDADNDPCSNVSVATF